MAIFIKNLFYTCLYRIFIHLFFVFFLFGPWAYCCGSLKLEVTVNTKTVNITKRYWIASYATFHLNDLALRSNRYKRLHYSSLSLHGEYYTVARRYGVEDVKKTKIISSIRRVFLHKQQCKSGK